MNKQRKVVSGSNYQTAGQPFEAPSGRPVRTEVDTTREDREEDRVTSEVIPSRTEDASPARRKLHPMWIIIPVVITVVLIAVIWSGAYFLVERLS
jgi:hypothetical protein